VGIHAEVVHNPSNIVELLAGSDLVITGAGTTCWELCLLGVPSILIELAPNQHGLAQALHEAGAALYVGKMEEIEPADLAHIVRSAASSQVVRRELSDVGRLLLDGQGASRVAAYLKNPLQLRQIGDADCKLLWEWANDPQARRMSFSRSPIPWDTHIRWFKEKMSDPGTMFLMSYREDDTPVGEVRYELDGDRAVVSINISPKFRGNGYGKHTLLLATEELFQRCSSANVIDAFVKPDNKISLQLFESAGFHLEGLRTLGGQEAVHYVLPKRVI
jgi:RimJ/RimL family protein N-acetyltransferase